LSLYYLGIENLLLFVISLELDYSDRTKGYSLVYGKAEKWKKVAELYGKSKPSRGKGNKKGAGVDDRRPPDTTKRLLKNNDSTNKKNLPQKYQSYSHYKNSCYITAPLEMLYNNYLHKMDWWSNNVGILSNNDSGLKKLYSSFTIRDNLDHFTAKKSTLNGAREMIRLHVVEKGWQKDGEFGSPTLWFENVIAEEKSSLKLLSHFCILGLRMWQCESGHVRIAPIPFKPFTPINGVEDFDSPFFEVHTSLIGQISAFFLEKNKLINRIRPDEPCQHSRASTKFTNLCKCSKRKINYQEFVISWPSTLIFEITQRDGDIYNSSDNLDFPLRLSYNEDDLELIEYILTGRVYSTSSSGVHFYSKIIRSFNEQKAVLNMMIWMEG